MAHQQCTATQRLQKAPARLVSILLLIALMALLFAPERSCAAARTAYLLTGKTMGTTYHIKVVAESQAALDGLQQRIDQRLEQINQSMSTYRPSSEINTFNALATPNAPFAASADFHAVMTVAAQIHRLSAGAWDGTVRPLIELWGFGTQRGTAAEPAPHEIARARERVGFDQIDVTASGVLRKKNADVTVDLGSIAKGYGVDMIATLIAGRGFSDFLVEIGGEVYAAGRRPDGNPWRVGINRPDRGAPANAVYKALPLQNQAMATSGDYRNFIVINGRAYSHIIDPRTGYPVQTGVVSASVIAPNCTLADGLATALMVMGAEKGVRLLNAMENVEGLVVVRDADARLHNFPTTGLLLK